jgi:hypothetical protein
MMARVAEAHAPPAKGLSGKWMIQRYDLRSARNVSNAPEQFSEWRPRIHNQMDYARPEVSIIESESNSVNNSGDARRLRLSTTQAFVGLGLIDGSSMAMKK